MLSITLPNLKLALWDLHDQSTFGLVDISSYEAVPLAEDVALQITAPGYETVNVTFYPNNVNIYKCSDLGITCGPTECCPLPDGIYHVKYTVKLTSATPTTINTTFIEKTFIKIDQILCKFDHMFAKVDLECNCGNTKQKRYKNTLEEVDLMIAAAVSAANDCNANAAFQLYQKADEILNNMCCDFNMTCESTFFCPQCQ